MLTILRNQELISQLEAIPFGLDAFYEENGIAKATLLFIHGFNGFKDWGHFDLMAEYFAKQGFVFVKFNLSHNGTTLLRPTELVNLIAYGNDTFSTGLDDTGRVIDFLYEEKCPFAAEMDLSRLYVIGFSRGGALAILKASEDKRVKALATWSSITSTLHFWTPENVEKIKKDRVVYVGNSRTGQKLPLYYAYYEDAVVNAERLNVEKAVKNLQIPAFFAHGSADTSVPTDYVHRLKSWKPDATLCLVEGANHTYGGVHPYTEKELPALSKTLYDASIDFFNKV